MTHSTTTPAQAEPAQERGRCQCGQWVVCYGPRRGEYHHRECKHWRQEFGNAIVTKTEIIVLGDPDEGDESHNCDEMGCTTVSHVMFRQRLSTAPEVAK